MMDAATRDGMGKAPRVLCSLAARRCCRLPTATLACTHSQPLPNPLAPPRSHHRHRPQLPRAHRRGDRRPPLARKALGPRQHVSSPHTREPPSTPNAGRPSACGEERPATPPPPPPPPPPRARGVCPPRNQLLLRPIPFHHVVCLVWLWSALLGIVRGLGVIDTLILVVVHQIVVVELGGHFGT